MDLSYLDSLSRRPQRLAPPSRRPLSMYVCGPTVYAPAHVGHARTYLLFDVVKRFFLGQGVKVHHVQNITDFEDKITLKARELGISWRTLARREEVDFHRDLAGLGVLPADENPRSSEFVPRMIALTRRLERQGAAYRKGGSVYFDASAVPRGGNFAVDELLSAHAVPEAGDEAVPEAADPRDFVLWKPSRPPAPAWSSPWGRGMPGWHLECFAMAERFLPIPLDLHGGGLDLVFPHHYAENLVSRALLGRTFSSHFLHMAFVTMGHEKMSKSLGNLFPLRQARAEFSPGGLRWYLLGKPYRERLEFAVPEARRAQAEWLEVEAAFRGLFDPSQATGFPLERLESWLERLPTLLAEDIGVPRAYLHLSRAAAEIRAHPRGALAGGDRRRGRALLREAQDLLGLPLLPPPSPTHSHAA